MHKKMTKKEYKKLLGKGATFQLKSNNAIRGCVLNEDDKSCTMFLSDTRFPFDRGWKCKVEKDDLKENWQEYSIDFNGNITFL